MSDKSKLQHLPSLGAASIANAPARSAIIARGLKDAANLAQAHAHTIPADLLQAAVAEEYFNRGMKFLNGQEVPQDLTKAAHNFRAAAEMGQANAQYHLGLLYEEGNGLHQDDVQAEMWIRRAAEQGEKYAQANLAYRHYYGSGVPQDYVEALNWCLKCASQGLAWAKLSLGRMYAEGEGCRQDYQQAWNWYLEAANQGDPDAEYELGQMYLQGKGVAKDYGEAYFWLLLSNTTRRGDWPERKRARELVAANLTEEEIAYQHSRATRWIAANQSQQI